MVLSKEHAVEYLAKAPVAFIGTISDVIPGITNYSLPPIHHYTLRLHNIRPLRGSVSATEFGYRQHGAGPSARAANGEEEEDVREPMRGVTYLACSSDGKYINDLVELDASIIERLLQSSRMPVGWSRQSNGQLESPWQHSHARQPKWYNDQQFAHCERCARSGRPALITADDVAFSCEPVKAAHTKEYQNPDGDGWYSIPYRNCSSAFAISRRCVSTDGDEQRPPSCECSGATTGSSFQADSLGGECVRHHRRRQPLLPRPWTCT